MSMRLVLAWPSLCRVRGPLCCVLLEDMFISRIDGELFGFMNTCSGSIGACVRSAD